MQHIHQSRTILFSIEQLYNLVGDIEKYPEFLPWCKQVKILRQSKSKKYNQLMSHDIKTADTRVKIGFGGIYYAYHCHVTWNRPQALISVKYLSGPLTDMFTKWVFSTSVDNPEYSHIDFTLKISFRHHVLNSMFNKLQLYAVKTMTDAFVRRAEGLYGSNNLLSCV